MSGLVTKMNEVKHNHLSAWRCRLVLPRSEHWITRRWHWHLNGHLGPTGMTGNLSTGTSGRPDPASSSIIKSKKPDWRKGRAQQAVTRSRERQADLMVLLAGSLEEERTQFKGLGGYTLKTVCLWLLFKWLRITICFWFNVIIGGKVGKEKRENRFSVWQRFKRQADETDAVWGKKKLNKRHWLKSRVAKVRVERLGATRLNTWV